FRAWVVPDEIFQTVRERSGADRGVERNGILWTKRERRCGRRLRADDRVRLEAKNPEDCHEEWQYNGVRSLESLHHRIIRPGPGRQGVRAGGGFGAVSGAGIGSSGCPAGSGSSLPEIFRVAFGLKYIFSRRLR